MDQFEPNLIIKKEVRYAEGLAKAIPNHEENFGDVFGGIIKSGQWGWLTKGSRLCITSLRTGQLISKYDFDASNGFGVCIITCVSEIQMPYLKDTLIAVGIQYADSPGGLVVLFSIEESIVIRCIDLKHKITCCKFLSYEVSQHTILQNMNGCLTVGTDGGSVLLVDLDLRNTELPDSKEETEISVVPCHIVDYSMSLLHLHRHFQHCQQEGVHFGIQLEVLDNAEFIQSLLPIDLILGLAVGLADGRLVLYDLTDMQVFYVANPQERSSPLVKMNFMEPPDDPRPCVYIWAFHENYQNSMAVMHSLMYEKRVVAEDGFCYFENFQKSSVRLQLPLSCPKSVPIACQAISKAPSHGNEETISLCALVWKQEQELQTEVLLFDINQWYKEEMPYVGDWREDPSYLASFILPGLCCLEMYFNPNTISLFNSIQRPEEHFYPISLSFDSIALGEKSCFHINWPGIQNRVINVLRSQGSLALLDPNPVFIEVLNARLLPQFSALNYKATFSLKAKRETLLSVAIENNCNGLLKECAKNWSDGSHQGTSLSEGLSLSTLTDWLWARASSIKERCNKLCKVLFDHSGYTLDQREKQELGYISKQLQVLADLSSDIISNFGENIPSDVLSTLESQGNSIRMASDYQEILLWLLNIGLLPEASSLARHREVELNLVPYPYESLHGFYEKRRLEFMRYSTRKTRSCNLLFIDSFLEHSFKGNTLRDSWQESGGDGLYPPSSVQAMLRIMLIPDVSFENKCALFLYFFLDLNMAIEDKRYEPIVQNFIKFPSVFKLSASLIKQIQAFWNLDHCHFQAAVDEFISPFNKDHVCPQWQIELFIAALLDQFEANLALRVLEAKSLPISPLLQLNTYLANDLISEAFHFARSEKDEELLKLFFIRCLLMKKFGVFRDLALTEVEGNLVQSLLKTTNNRKAEDLSMVYLLQKYKYIEAVAYQDELLKGRDIQRAMDELSKGRNTQTDVDTPNLVLSAYHTTMTPVTKNISDVYLKIKNRIKNKETEQDSPVPLSCQFIKQNATDLLGGIYHGSALGTHFASHYWDQQPMKGNALQTPTNAPFIRSPQMSLLFSEYNPKEVVSYPEPFKVAEKRRLDNSPVDLEKNNKTRENPKKRRKIYDQYDFELSASDNLLTHFKNSSTYNQDLSVFKKQSSKNPSQENSFLLETPYVQNNPADDLSSKIPERQGTPLPGILKVSNPKASIDETDRVREVSEEPEKKKEHEEEKIIRFILPVDESLEQIDETSEQIDEPLQQINQPSQRRDEQDVSMESGDVVEQSFNRSQQPLRTYVGPATRKSLRSPTNYTSSVSISNSELRSILDRVRTEQPKHESISKLPSNEGPEKSKDSHFAEPSFNEELSVRSSVARAPKTYDFPNAPSKISESKWLTPGLEADKSAESDQRQFKSLSNVNENPQPKAEHITRANSESSDGQSNDSMQRNKKQLRGRASIHSSPEEKSNYNTPTAPQFQETSNPVLQHAKTVFSTDTIIDFKPHTSSSKVWATESRITTNTTESSVKVIENESKLQSTSKVTFSERTTIIGELTSIPPMSTEQYVKETLSATLQPSEKEKEKMLDTTVGMSLYDTMGFDSENSSSTSDNIRDQDHEEEESTNSELNYLNDDTTGTEENDDGGSSVILVSSGSSSRAASRNQDFESHQFEPSKQKQRHISIDDEDEDEYDDYEDDDDDDDNYDDEMESNEDEDLDDSVNLIESDGSEDLSNPFSNKVRNVTSTSTSSSVANLLGNAGSLPLLQNQTIIKTYCNVPRSETFTFETKCETSSSGEKKDVVKGEQEPSESKETTQPGLKLSVTSESIQEQETIDITKEEEMDTNEKSCHAIKVDLPKGPDHKPDDGTKGKTANNHNVLIESEKDVLVEQKEPVAENVENKSEQGLLQSEDIVIVSDIDVQIQLEEHVAQNVEIICEGKIHVSEDVKMQTQLEQSSIQKDGNNKEIEENSTNSEETERKSPNPSNFDEKGSQIKATGSQINEIIIGEVMEQFLIKPEEIIKSKCDAKSCQSEEHVTEVDTIDKTADEEHEIERKTPNPIECDEKNSKTDGDIVQLDETVITAEVDHEIEKKSSKPSECDVTSSKTEGDKAKLDEVDITADEEHDIERKAQNPSQSDAQSSQTEGDISQIGQIDRTANEKHVIDNEEIRNISTLTQETDKTENISDSQPQKKENEKESEIKTVASEENEHKADNQAKSNQKEVLKTAVPSDEIEEKNEEDAESSLNIDTTFANEDTVDKQKQTAAEDELILNLRKRRSKSFSKNLTNETEVVASPRTQRLSRSGSMPPSTGNPIVTRRRSLLLETLDEHATPDSPSTRTRSKLHSESIDGDGEVVSPSVSNAKRSRRSSFSSVTSVEQPQTPKTRRRSITVEKEQVNTPKAVGAPRTTRVKSITSEVTTTPVKTPRRLSVSKKDSPVDEDSPVSTNKAKVQKTKEKESSMSPAEAEAESSQNDDLMSSRRLTRTQLAAIERNSALAKQTVMSPVVKKRRGSNTTEKESPPSAKGSDNESNSSRISHLSNSTTSRRITRSLALKENADDLASIASSTESNQRKRKRAKEQFSPTAALKVIPEEIPSGSEGSVTNSETGKRPTRHKK